MVIETKYNLNTEVWRVGVAEADEVKCKCCGRMSYKPIKFEVDKTASPILWITYYGFKTTYGINFDSALNESEIDSEGALYFTTPEAAQAECDRRNKEID